jgi:hypothetical protein
LIEQLQSVEGVDVIPLGGSDLGNATRQLFDLVRRSERFEHSTRTTTHAGLVHLPQPLLDLAAASAVPKILTDGGMAWDRKKSPVDVAPLVAVTEAVWGLMKPQEAPRVSAYDRGASLAFLD